MSHDTNDVDVVVVSYNSAPLLGEALSGLPPCASVTVVDNTSADRSIEVARAHGAHVIENPVNAGFAAASNQGARRGTAQYLLFLNPDTRPTPEAIDALVRALDGDATVGAVSPRLRQADGREQRAAWPFPSARAAWREALGLHRLGRHRDAPGFVIGACFLTRRSVFEALGGFDTRFWLYAEEADYCRRMADAGLAVRVIDDVEIGHIGGASSVGAESLTTEHFERGAEHFVRRHEGRRALVSLRGAQLLGSVLRLTLPTGTARKDAHRSRLRHVTRSLSRHPTTVPFDSPATTSPNVGLVVCSLEPWDEVWRRNQFFVRELLVLDPNRRILFVEPPFDWVHEARHRSPRRRTRGLRPLEGDSRVSLFEPAKVWPRLAGPLADRSLRRQVREAAHALGFVRPTVWVNDPNFAGLATTTRWPAVYDITDDWGEAAGAERFSRRVLEREQCLYQECEAVVVCSDGLAATRRAWRPDLTVIPNGVDVEHFATPQPRPADLPAGPTAVYVGTLHEDRFDVDLVERLARERTDLHIVLVGPDALTASAHDRLAAQANVHLLGPRAYARIPGYLQHADVVIVPHVVSPFTESLDPIKAYECVAVGRPTIATPVAGFRGLDEPVRTVDREAFVGAVGDAIAFPIDTQGSTAASWADRALLFDRQLGLARARAGIRTVRVVFVGHCAKLSGGELALARVLPALRDAHVQAHVILGEHGPLEQRLRDTGAVVEVLALNAAMAATHRDEVTVGSLGVQRVIAAGRDTWALSRRLRALEPDLVHTNTLKAALYGGVAGRLAGIPVIWHIRDRIAPDYLPAPVVRGIHVLLRLIPKATIANSQATMATMGTTATRMAGAVIASPVVYDAVVPTPSEDLAGGDGFRVAMLGRLAPWKGQHIFLHALAEAFGDTPFTATIVGSAMFGEDAYEQEIKELITTLGLADRVTLTGFLDDVTPILHAADCLVHASTIPEPFGQVVLEGMAAGLAVIAADAGGPKEIIRDGVNGLLFTPGDSAMLARLLSTLANNPERRRALGREAALRSLDFSPDRIAGEIRDLYDVVLDQASPLTSNRRKAPQT